ncbi:MAG TPA: carboxymuconolactone decarboxylase family protein [Solirubrobacteraceae bacterium]|jgi:AhpD family alkylhydroperoxidase|nr:carboxymuconolactone decarboxylase family protein [Solirubrobacteraceae bacterium]
MNPPVTTLANPNPAEWNGASPGEFLVMLTRAGATGVALRGLLDSLRVELPERTLELIALRTSAQLDCSYSWSGHVHIALDRVLTMQEIACVAANGNLLGGTDALTLGAVDELLRDGLLSNETRSALGEEADRVTIAMTSYQLVARLTARMTPEPRAERVLSLASPLRARITYAALVHAGTIDATDA